MKQLIARIRKILRDRRTRQLLTRLVSVFAAIVVFVTTYALVLPAVTMELNADCGIEAHQHNDECYEFQLMCEIPESPGHVHTDACYQVEYELKCDMEEHVHGDACFDDAGNLACTKEEHTHGNDCYEETRTLVCGLEESEGHTHDESCYEKVLTCGKEVHVHSAACYESDPVEESAVAASTGPAGTAGVPAVSLESMDTDMGDVSNPAEPVVESAGVSSGAADPADMFDAAETHINAGTYDDTENPLSAEAGEEDPAAAESDIESSGDDENKDSADGADFGSENAVTGVTEEASAAITAAAGLDGDSYVPQLEPVDFNAMLNGRTGVYYHAAGEGEVVEDSTALSFDQWKHIDEKTELGKNDLLRVYLAYAIPAGSLNATNPAARYRLPGNLHLTDAQVKAINETVNGIAGQYVDYNTLEITDPEKYHAYLGVEAVEGTWIPTEDPEEYLHGLADSGREAAEYISAVVHVENVYSETGGDYEGQDLVFTFTPYSIEKNQHEYDAGGQPARAGEVIKGWLTLDFNLEQVDWTEQSVDTFEREAERDEAETEGIEIETVERTVRTADLVFVGEGRDENNQKIEEISTSLTFVDENVTQTQLLANDAADALDTAETASAEAAADSATAEEAASNSALDSTSDSITDSATPGSSSDVAAGEGTSEDGRAAEEETVIVMPAMSFSDSIKVSTGKPAGIDENAGGTVANAAGALPEEAEVSVRVEADEGTFPAGTTMKLGAVSQDSIDELTDKLVENVESGQPGQEENKDSSTANDTEKKKNLKTYGFQAVDITFLDKDGNEIEPAKPVRVALTSTVVEQVKEEAKESSVAEPVVVHVDNDGNAEQMELVDPAEIEPAVGRSEEELVEESEAAIDSMREDKEDAGASDLSSIGQTSSGAAVDNDAADADENVNGETTDEADATLDNNDKDADAAETESASESSTVGFTTDSFSVYAIVYTVDFHYDVDGTTYDYSIKGGDTISMKELLPILNVITDDVETDVNEVQTFINDIESVEFSDESLIKAMQIMEDTTAGKLKEKIKNETGAEIAYSADLTEEQITEMNARELTAVDWALVSLKAFGSEETLTVSMKSGEVFEIHVTDENTPAPAAAGNPPNAFYGEDTTKYATKISLFDYGPTNNSTDKNQNLDCEANNLQGNANSNLGINANHALKFFSYGKKPSDVNQTRMGINHFSGGPYAVQGIVSDTLTGGYPTLNGGNSLDYLFNDWESGTTKQVYSNVTNLFQRDSNGKFFYDSNANYAYYNPAQGDNGKVVLGSTFTEEGSDWGVGFFPFDGYNDYYNCIHGDGINWCGSNGTNKVGHYNHHFGMSMNVDFMMSSDHRMSGQEMMFNFRGDDDMWVFVDDVLILDIGGVHNPVGGWINFTKQTVHVDSAIQVGNSETSYQAVNKTFAELFADAGRVWDNSAYADHTLKVFYIERGGCYSNLQVEYNLTRYIDYEFYKKDQHGEPVPGAKFSLYKEDGTRLAKEVQVDNNGEITGTTYFEATSDADGRVYFDHVPLGKYEIREIETPSGYVKNGATYKAILEVREKADAPGQYDAITYLEKTAGGVTTRVEPKEIINYKDVEVSLEKYWNSTNNSTPPSGAKASFTLMRNQKVLPKEVTVIFQYSDGTEISRETGLYDGDTAIIKDYELATSPPSGWSSSSWDRITMSAEGKVTIIGTDNEMNLSTETKYAPDGYEWYGWHHTGWHKDTVTSQEVRYIVNSDHADSNNLIVLRMNKTSSQFAKPPGMFVERGELVHDDDWENVPALSFTLPDEADEGESWKKTLENLPAADPYGNRYKYYIVENEITGVSNANSYTWDYITSEGTEADPLEEGGQIGIINIETVTAKIVKQWDHTGNDGTRPASLTVVLSNGETKELTAANNWTAEVSGLPKYDRVTGDLIKYSWTEEELPEGYYLSSIQSNTNETTGVIATTLTNTFTSSYNPLTKIRGKKIWDDGGFYRPDSITVKLYKDGGSTPYRELTVQAPTTPGANQNEWPFEFTNLPIFNENGSLAQYTVEEVLPAGYTGNYSFSQNFSQATYVAGTATYEIINPYHEDQEIATGTDLGFVVIRHGNDFVVWTPRPLQDGELETIKTTVKNASEQFNKIMDEGRTITCISGMPKTVNVGKKPAVSLYMKNGGIWVKYLDPSAQSDMVYGKIPYTYTQAGGEGGGTITNTLKTVSVNATKAWVNTSNTSMTPADGTTVTFDVFIGETALNKPVVLNGKTDVRTLDEDSTVARTQEVNTAALDAKAYESAPWIATWAGLPEKDASGNLIQYTVKETVCPNGFENQTIAGVTTGGTITNKQTTIDISFVKTDGSGNKLEGAKFQLWVDDAASSASSHYVLVKSASGYATGYEGIRFNDGTGAADVELTTVYANEKTLGTGVPYESGFVTSDQTMTLKNLPDGKYKLVEVDAPDGYVILANGVFFEITNGVVSSSTATDSSTSDKVHLNTAGSTAILTVDNTPGTSLPNTGGPGTKFLYFSSLILTVLAGAGLMKRKRRRAAKG